MKKAAMVLGIVGGSIYLLVGIIYTIMGVVLLANQGNPVFDSGAQMGGAVCLTVGLVLCAGAGLGMAGGITVKKHYTASGVMMIVGCVLNFFNILLLLGGIFALIPEKQPVYPPYPYPPYPQYQPYPPYPNGQPYIPYPNAPYPQNPVDPNGQPYIQQPYPNQPQQYPPQEGGKQ